VTAALEPAGYTPFTSGMAPVTVTASCQEHGTKKMGSASPLRHSPTVLMLEDDPDFAAAAAEAMRGAGLEVLTALHPWDAFHHLDGGREIDLFLTDIRMPRGMPHGFAMARMARYRRPKLKLLFITAYRDMAEAEGDRLGAVLFKPIGPEALTQGVRQALAAA
jgi:CheY-like chemotaxis protein